VGQRQSQPALAAEQTPAQDLHGAGLPGGTSRRFGLRPVAGPLVPRFCVSIPDVAGACHLLTCGARSCGAEADSILSSIQESPWFHWLHCPWRWDSVASESPRGCRSHRPPQASVCSYGRAPRLATYSTQRVTTGPACEYGSSRPPRPPFHRRAVRGQVPARTFRPATEDTAGGAGELRPAASACRCCASPLSGVTDSTMDSFHLIGDHRAVT